MSEQPAHTVGDTAFCRPDTTASVQYLALRPDLARLRGDGANERNFEFERRAAETFSRGRLNGQTHATVEKCRRGLNWKVVQRGFWVHGVGDLRAYLASAELFTMKGRADLISCPTLITQAENDTLSAGAGAFYDALSCPKTLMRFTAAEGGDGHCEMGNRSLLNRRALDWLDEQFGTFR